MISGEDTEVVIGPDDEAEAQASSESDLSLADRFEASRGKHLIFP